MHRHRNSKGRFIASKILENLDQQTTKNHPPPPPPQPHTNSANLCAGTILRGESSKEEIETTTKGPESKATVHIENIVQQVRREALVTQLEGRVGKETEVVAE
jgi:hypothetical protein